MGLYLQSFAPSQSSSSRLDKTLLQLKGVAVGALGASGDFCAGISLLEGRGRLAAGQAVRGHGCPQRAGVVPLAEL